MFPIMFDNLRFINVEEIRNGKILFKYLNNYIWKINVKIRLNLLNLLMYLF